MTHAPAPHDPLTKARRIVVKIGSSLLVDPVRHQLKTAWLHSVAIDIARLYAEGREVLIVSSGSVALGRRLLDLPHRGRMKLEESQAAASIGQITLAHSYQELFASQGLKTAQILLTLGDTEERRRYLNARNTLNTLLGWRAVPVVNENDTVATSEIRYGDNDRLAARVASMMTADLLIILSDVDGLYDRPPGQHADARHLPHITAITPQIEAMAGGIGTDYGTGGMKTKIAAAKIAMAAGVNMIIAAGQAPHPLQALRDGARHSYFDAASDPVMARKRWIAASLKPKGQFVIDAGAIAALCKGKSLLPAGVKAVEGRFARGDAVIIQSETGTEIGRGLTAYGDHEARRIMGANSARIADLLGYAGRAALIHRDDMVVHGCDQISAPDQ